MHAAVHFLTVWDALVNLMRSSCTLAALSWSTYASKPGGPGRWTLADDSTGLDSMAVIYATMDTMSDQLTLFTTLQGLTLLLLILRLLRILSAQKRLSILTTTAVQVHDCTCAGMCARACIHVCLSVSSVCLRV